MLRIKYLILLLALIQLSFTAFTQTDSLNRVKVETKAFGEIFTTVDSLREILRLVDTDSDSLEVLAGIMKFHAFYGRNFDSISYYADRFFALPAHTAHKQLLLIIDGKYDYLAKKGDAENWLAFANFLENSKFEVPNQDEIQYRIWKCRAAAYVLADKTKESLNALDKLLHYSHKTDNPLKVMETSFELGEFYSNFSNAREIAIKHFKNAYAQAQLIYKEYPEVQNISNRFISAQRLGSEYLYAEKPDSAILYLEEALDMYHANTDIIPSFYMAIAEMEYANSIMKKKNGDDTLALQKMEYALPMIEGFGNPHLSFDALLSATEHYLKLNLTTKAKQTLSKAKTYVDVVDDKELHKTFYKLSHKIARYSNPEQAIKYRDKEIELWEELQSEDNSMNLARIEAQFQFEQERKELVYQQSLQAEQIKRQRSQMILSGLGVLLLGAFSFSTYQNKRQKERTNQELLKVQQQLEQNNRRLSRFAQSVSHDIMGKLESMLTSSSRIKADHLPTLEAQYYYENTKTSANWLRNYCMALLTWSEEDLETENTTLAETDVQAIVQDLLKIHKAELEYHGFEVIVDELPHLQIPNVPLQQVFKNLIDNAIKYTKDQEKPKIKISAILEANEWVFCIKDNGIGVPIEKHQTIFDKTNNTTQLHGRGLSYVNELLFEYSLIKYVIFV